MTATYLLDLIEPNPWQPRKEIDLAGIEELALSIAREGLMQMPIARLNPNAGSSNYQLAIGHRRLKAFEMLSHYQVVIENGGDDDQTNPLTEWVKVALAAGRTFDEIPLDIQLLTDQQMFEMAIQENLQRKDLNPVEQAEAEQRYMAEFHASSKAAGIFFGKSDATIRGDVRLLDLPEKPRKALEGGQITVGTARLLLSASKIVDVKAINSMMADIDKGEELPEAVVQDHLDQERGTVVEMWAKYNGAQPRGGCEGWPLDMKNFPNKMLAPLDAEETAALDADKIEHLVNPPACTACPYYVKVNGDHYCGLRVCFARKVNAYKANKLADLSRTLKIEIYQKTDGAYIPLDNDHASHRKAFENRNPDLRLIEKDLYQGAWVWQDFKGLNREIAKLVVIGQSVEKLAVKGSHTHGGKKSETEKAEARALKLYRKQRKELMWEYTAVAESIFVGVPTDVLTVLAKWNFVGVDDRIPDAYQFPEKGSDDEKQEWHRRNLIWHMIADLSSHYRRESLVSQLEKFGKRTTVPADELIISIAGKWDDEIKALALVSTETEEA